MDAIRNAVDNHIKKRAYQILTLRATVLSYDKSERTCKVKLEDGTEIDDVLIQPISSYEKGIVIYPGVDSKVILEKIESQDMALKISSYTEIAEIEVDIAQFSVKWDKTGLKIGNQGEDLKTVLNDHMTKMEEFMTQMSAFAEEVSKVIVIVGTTVNIPAVVAIKAQVESIKTQSGVIKNRLNKIMK